MSIELIPYNVEFIIFDVDDVFLDTKDASKRAASAIETALQTGIGESKSQQVKNRFVSQYDFMLSDQMGDVHPRNPKIMKLKNRIMDWQNDVKKEGYSTKFWSREVHIAIALEREEIKPTQDLIEIASNAYWEAITKETKLNAGSKTLVHNLRKRNIKFHLASNSDGFLKLNENGDSFYYDWKYSKDKKYQRMERLWELGINESHVSVGDPVGKPEEEFFRSVISDFESSIGCNVDLTKTLCVGDGIGVDIEPLLSMGVPMGFWMNHNHQNPIPTTHPTEHKIMVGSKLDQIQNWLGF